MGTIYEFLDKNGLSRYHQKIKSFIEGFKYDDTDVKSEIKNNSDAIAILNGDSSHEGSVKSTVVAEIAKILNGASASFDTLKEIEDWISKHTDGAAAMNSKISENEKNITSLTGRVDSLEETSTKQSNDINSIKSDYATKKEVSELESVYATKEEVSALNDVYATKKELSDVENKINKLVDGSDGTVYTLTVENGLLCIDDGKE